MLWHNMREEPVIYINGKPYVVREAGQPFANLEYTGIDRSRVEDMEVRAGGQAVPLRLWEDNMGCNGQ